MTTESYCENCENEGCICAENGPSDQQQEDAAEAHDLAKERFYQEMVDSGRGHLVGR